ncbi:MAG: hypothetical protein LC732_02430, partial [Acidobacteria bacterium]|nr:hypothetical protein [Acidobacteriota bacterium]
MIRRSVYSLLAALIAFLVQGCATVVPVTHTPIFAVQGERHISPLAGTDVTLRGVVTAVVTRERDAGFFVQDPRGDGNSRTSDALFVDMARRPAGDLPSIGDYVEVTGTVEERGRENQLSVTLIANPVVQALRNGDPLPAPIVIGGGGKAIPVGSVSSEGMQSIEPEAHAIDFWESLEGMLVELREAVVTGATSYYGDLVVIGDGGAEMGRRTAAGGVILREGHLNLDRVVIDSRIETPFPETKVGDRFASALRGVVHYDFGAPRVLALAWPELKPGDTTAEVTGLVSGDRALTVASYNVLNLSFTSHERRFADVARTIAVNLRSPDVIGLQEIQDDSGPNRESDGVVSAERTMGRLVEGIAAAGGARYQWAQIDPEVDRDGGQPGGNIRVVWMYRPDRVTLVARGSAGPGDATAATSIDGRLGLSLSPGRIDPRNPCVDNAEGEGSRKSLAAEFRFRGETIFLINNHLVSKSNDDRIFGSIQPPRRGSEPQRICQAEILRDFTRSLLAVDPRA